MNANTKIERFGMWIAWLCGGYGSPSLYFSGLRPSFRWVFTGLDRHAQAR